MASKPTYEELEQRIQALAAENEALRQKEAQYQAGEAFLSSALDSLSANIAIINETGDIVFVNQTWREFAEQNGVTAAAVSEGTNYFSACRQSAGSDAFDADRFANGIEQVLTGEKPSFSMVYPCHSPEKARWFIGQVLPIAENQGRHALVVHTDITEQKQAEAKQDEYERLLNSTLESVDSLLMVINENHRIVLCNWKDHEWVPDSERQKRPFCYKAMKNFDAPCSYCPPLKTFADGQVRCYEDQNPIDGSYKEISVIPILNEAGDVAYVLENVRDLTVRKHSENALRESEAKLRAIVDASPMAIVLIDRQGRVLDCNHEHAARFQMNPSQMMGKCIWDILPETVRVHRKSQVKQVFETGVPINGEDERDGTWNEYTVHPAIWDETGQIEAVVVEAMNITPRKQAEAALRRSEQKFRDIFDNASDAIFIHNMGRRFLEVNTVACRRLGYDREKLLQMGPRDIAAPDYVDLPPKMIEKIKQNGQAVFEAVHQRSNGTVYPVEISSRKIEFEGNECILNVVRDITERKQAEAEKARLETQINQTQKLESVGRLAGGVAHDLNNLLTPVLGYSEMLLDETSPESPQKRPLKEIENAAYRARNLVRQLLAFSRKQLLEFQSINLNDFLTGFRQFLERTLRENIAIYLELAPNLPSVEGDRTQLEQVIINLAINAQDAMPDGGQLTIETNRVELDESYASTHQGVTPGPYVMIAVSDTGCGMDAETRENLFEPFFTTKEVDKGTGLGLATVYGIVKQHGGNIWVYSEPGLGSVFKIYLPASENPAEHTRAETAESTAPVSNPQGSETILLVEDHPQVQNLARATLDNRGYTVLAAENGGQALSMLKTHEGALDLLLTDVVMPEMDGKELYEKVSGIYPNVRVLYMSGYSENVIANHGVIDEGVNFIQKPFSIKTLSAKVREVLDKPWD